MKFYKVFFHQSFEKSSDVQSVLCENYCNLSTAINNGISNMYDDNSYFLVKEYDTSSGITMIGKGDNGKIVYYKGGSIIDYKRNIEGKASFYDKNDANISLMDCPLSTKVLLCTYVNDIHKYKVVLDV